MILHFLVWALVVPHFCTGLEPSTSPTLPDVATTVASSANPETTASITSQQPTVDTSPSAPSIQESTTISSSQATTNPQETVSTSASSQAPAEPSSEATTTVTSSAPITISETTSPQATVATSSTPQATPVWTVSPDVHCTKKNSSYGHKLGLVKGIPLGYAVLVILAIGVLSALIATSFYSIRKNVFHDAKNLDTAFDAGGTVSISLTASTIVSHWTWGATLLQSCTVAAKYGLSGPYWYAAGATIQIILFAILSIQLKTKAPGAKTFLQVIYARFGKTAHIVFCFFALLTNLIIQVALMVSGIAVIVGLVDGLTSDLAALLLGLIIGTYTLIGGLGATFYVSYFNTAMIYSLLCWLVIEVFYNPSQNPKNPFGSSNALYNLVSCWEGPENNYQQSYFTFYSPGGAVFGVVNIIGNFGAVFCDQAYWQKSIAAKPLHGVWGFVLGALTWFAVPFALATTMGLAYIGLNTFHGEELLSSKDVESGLVAPFVAQHILSKNGEFVMMTLLLLVVMAAGSSEVIAVAAIVVYDIYQIYLKPFKTDLTDDQCTLCSRLTRQHPGHRNVPDEMVCNCHSMSGCQDCKNDNAARATVRGLVKPHFTCSVHKEYREYMDKLLYYKNWWIVNATILSVILSLLATYATLDLNWLYLLIGVLISSAVFPIAFSIMWTRATASGVVTGSLSGLILALISWLAYASTLPGGLSNFLENTGNERSMLVGNVVAILGGGIITVVVSIISKPHWTDAEKAAEWEKTRNIDNPLRPWFEGYEKELNLKGSRKVIHDRPALDVVVKKFRPAWLTALITAVSLVLMLLLVWPLAMLLGVDILTQYGFLIWTTITRGWAYLATGFIILVPLIQEGYSIIMQMRRNRKENPAFPHDTAAVEFSDIVLTDITSEANGAHYNLAFNNN